jgi:type IV secretion system protein VirB4
VQAGRHGIAVDRLTPEQWLDAFYENRKGSGKGFATVSKSRKYEIAS